MGLALRYVDRNFKITFLHFNIIQLFVLIPSLPEN